MILRDRYRVLPHRDMKVIGSIYEHKPCDMRLRPENIEDNWCPYCAKTINQAAARRARAEWQEPNP